VSAATGVSGPPATPEAAAARLLLRRRAVRRSLLAWCSEALAPLGQAPAAHHRLLIGRLAAAARGEVARLMVLMPPGSAKSTYASHLFPAWFLGLRPGLSVLAASHTAALADAFSRRVQGLVRAHAGALGYSLASEGAGLWRTTTGGQYRAAGVGGPITGFRADLAVVDDPVKSRAEADSREARDRAWEWWNADLRTRLRPGAPIVLITTRWHEDDPAGRLLQEQAELWEVLRLPAFAEPGDPLGRAGGEPLWADDGYGYAGELRRVRRELGARDWAALYQQSPRPMEGGIFKVGQIAAIDAEPAGLASVRAWDLAATGDTGTRDADWTVGALLGRTGAGAYVVLDVVRFQGGPDEVERAILATAARDGRRVPVGIPQDPGQAGVAQAQYLVRRLFGHRVHASRETGDKATRAMPFAAQVNVGNVSLLRGPWNRALLDELAAFPSGSKDDQVDALSRGFGQLSSGITALERFRVLA
jgi:predicted phage terminase large subunit-like protein